MLGMLAWGLAMTGTSDWDMQSAVRGIVGSVTRSGISTTSTSTSLPTPLVPDALLVIRVYSHNDTHHWFVLHGLSLPAPTYCLSNVLPPAAGIVLGKHSGRNALSSRLRALGYELNSSEVDDVFG